MKKTVREIDWKRVRAELADLIQEAQEENATFVRYDSDTGEAWKVSPDGAIEPYEMADETDWERVRNFTEEEIERMAEEDDSLPADWLDHAVIVRHPGKMVNGKHS